TWYRRQRLANSDSSMFRRSIGLIPPSAFHRYPTSFGHAARRGWRRRMRATSRDRGISLPARWPGYVRSAVVHAVSMARVATAVARARVEHRVSGPGGLRARIDGLERDNRLLREELRIKDARMERVPADRRPHYPPIERLSILEL